MTSGDPLLSAPVVCQLTGVRATGIAAVQAVVRSNEQEAERHGLLLFMSSWGIHTLTRAFSLQHTHGHTRGHRDGHILMLKAQLLWTPVLNPISETELQVK